MLASELKQKRLEFLKKTFTIKFLLALINDKELYKGICIPAYKYELKRQNVMCHIDIDVFNKSNADVIMLIKTYSTKKKKLTTKYHWAYGNVKSRKLFLIKVLKELHGYEYKQ